MSLPPFQTDPRTQKLPPQLAIMTITPDNRKLFESMGVDAVRTDLLRAFEGNQRIPPGHGRHEAPEWISEQERKQRRRETWRYWTTVWLMLIAAIAACIAAWPIVKGWLP
jgi:hypothetical protein